MATVGREASDSCAPSRAQADIRALRDGLRTSHDRADDQTFSVRLMAGIISWQTAEVDGSRSKHELGKDRCMRGEWTVPNSQVMHR